MNSFDQVKHRSGNRCEAMIVVGHGVHVHTRCFRSPVEVHHMLTRSRGGLILDDAGETIHLLALCSAHHKEAHAPGGHDKGLMIDGYVRTENGRPVYEGSHDKLSLIYGPVDMSRVRDDVPRYVAGEGL